MKLELIDDKTFYNLPPGAQHTINFDDRTSIQAGYPDPLRHLVRVKLACIAGRVNFKAAWPGLRAPFTLMLDAGESHSFTWLLQPLALTPTSEVTVENHYAPDDALGKPVPTESTYQLVIVGSL